MEKFAIILEPLYKLLKKGAKWNWGDAEQAAFLEMKQSLVANVNLRHYDPSKELVLKTDASKIGIGAVLLQPDEHGYLLPLSF